MQFFLKRCIDIAVASSLLVALAPVLLVLAWLVRRKLGTPIFFRQRRIGYKNQPFHLIKFRTMTDERDENGNLLPDDVRLTEFGQFLRSTSLDELPELWNILTGKMSLVGPRPLLPEYLPFYTEEELLRHAMRPGITGLAQVNGRNALGWNERLAFDVQYVREFELLLDLKILWRTAAVVLHREGISAEGHVTMRRLDSERSEQRQHMSHEGRIFLSPPHMGGNEKLYMEQAFASNYIAPLGPMVEKFEADFTAITGIPHCVALTSGTAAIHLALRCYGVGPGDTVFASSLTFIGSVAPIMYQGATPILIDADRESWTMDVNLLAEALADAKKRHQLPKAVLPTDLYGQSCNAKAIKALCDEYGVKLVIDAAESVGATYEGQHAGYYGDAAAFSFNGNKIITTSGGGMLASHDKKLIDEARFLSQQARDPAPHYQHHTYGYNYRMSNLIAAVGCGQLEVLAERVARRRAIFAYYAKHLGSLPGITFMPEMPYGTSNRWLTTLLIDPAQFGADRETIRLALEAENIESRPLWKPLHQQPAFEGCAMIGGAVGDAFFEQGLCLPSGTKMTDADLDRVIAIIKRTGGHA